MKYADGKHVRVGDRVAQCTDQGVVVCFLDSVEFSEGFPIDEWSYLGSGILVDFEQAGLVHFPSSDTIIELVRIRSN